LERIGGLHRWSPRWFKQVDSPSDAAQYEEITEYEECVSGNWELATDYQEHRATITASAHVPTEFRPWQYA
jgi:hypothetical protein